MPNQYERDFSVVFGSIFSLETTITYLDALIGLLGQNKAIYAQNKAKQCQKACEVLNQSLMREFNKRLTPEERAISDAAIKNHIELISDFFNLDQDQQDKVTEFIKTIK